MRSPAKILYTTSHLPECIIIIMVIILTAGQYGTTHQHRNDPSDLDLYTQSVHDKKTDTTNTNLYAGFLSEPAAKYTVNLFPRIQRNRTDRHNRLSDSKAGRFLLTIQRVVRAVVTQTVLFTKRNLHFMTYGVIILLSCAVFLYAFIYFRRKVESKRFLTATRLSLMDKEVRIACRYIENNFDDSTLNTESICNALVTGKAFLEVLFEQELGMSIDAFITQVRINRAKLLLEKNHALSASDVYIEVGYVDLETFLSDFLKVSGVSFDVYAESAQAFAR